MTDSHDLDRQKSQQAAKPLWPCTPDDLDEVGHCFRRGFVSHWDSCGTKAATGEGLKGNHITILYQGKGGDAIRHLRPTPSLFNYCCNRKNCADPVLGTVT